MRDIKQILKFCLSETIDECELTREEYDYAYEWVENNIADQRPHWNEYECKLYGRLSDEMQSEYEQTGVEVDRDYLLGMEDFKQLKAIHGAFEMSVMIFNGDFGRYRLVFGDAVKF